MLKPLQYDQQKQTSRYIVVQLSKVFWNQLFLVGSFSLKEKSPTITVGR